MSTNLCEATAPRVQLETALPDWCVLKWQQCALAALFVISFLYLSYVPVSNPQTWHESTYGALGYSAATKNNLLPLSEGMRHPSFGSAGKTIVSSLHVLGGPRLLGFSFALLQTSILILWSVVFYRLCRNWWFMGGLVFIQAASFFQFTGLRSETFGQLCFAILTILLVNSRSIESRQFNWHTVGRYHWVLVFLIFAAWANLHASVAIGLLVLCCFAVSRLFDFSNRQNRFAIFNDIEFQNRVWLVEFALLATLFNPVGIGLWKSAVWWPDNPILHGLGGWSPAVFASWTGLMVAVGWAAWFTAARKSNSLSIFLTLSIVVATIAVAFVQSSVVWFAPLMAIAVADLLTRKKNIKHRESKPGLGSDSVVQPVRQETKKPKSFQFAFTLITGLFIWLGFCLSPQGSEILGGKQRTIDQIVGASLPRPAKQFLKENPPDGLLLSPSFLADWIQADTGLPSMVSSNFALVPETVAVDYQKIYSGDSNWRKLTEKYALTDMLVEKSRQPTLIRHLRRRPGEWQIAFEDNRTMIFRRQP